MIWTTLIFFILVINTNYLCMSAAYFLAMDCEEVENTALISNAT